MSYERPLEPVNRGDQNKMPLTIVNRAFKTK